MMDLREVGLWVGVLVTLLHGINLGMQAFGMQPLYSLGSAFAGNILLLVPALAVVWLVVEVYNEELK